MTNLRCAALRAAVLPILALALLAAAPAGRAGEPASPPTVAPLFGQALADLGGRRLMVAEVSYAPGGASVPHRHPGHVFVYVLEGAIESQLEDGAVVTYRAGESFYESPLTLHATARNASDSEPARLIAFMILEPDQPVSLPEP